MSRFAVETPAPLLDTVDLFRRDGFMAGLHIKAAILQHRRSDTYAFSDRGGIFMVLGFAPVLETADESVLELWFACTPALVPHLLPAARAVRLTLQKLAQTSGLTIRARVNCRHRPGQRLARLIGMEQAGQDGDVEVWQWQSQGLKHEALDGHT